jgi:filamentous hemagglutinin
MEPVTPIEKALADQIRAGNDQGGHLTEQLLGMIAERQGYTVLSGTKYGSNNGFDLVLQAADGSVTIVMDGKQMTNGTIQLSRGAGDNIQLTDKWVATVLDRLPINSPARLAIEKARRAQSLITAVGGVDRATGQVVITRVQVPGGD